MAISLSFNVSELKAALSDKQLSSIAGGGLDGNEVWYEYLTQEDDRVRPSHAALHGTRWRADDPEAPTPPLDYGCRCFIRYIAKPNTDAAEILPEADGGLSTRSEAYSQFLTDNLDDWRKIYNEAKYIPPIKRYQFLLAELADAGLSASDSKEYAAMIMAIK